MLCCTKLLFVGDSVPSSMPFPTSTSLIGPFNQDQQAVYEQSVIEVYKTWTHLYQCKEGVTILKEHESTLYEKEV